MAPSCGRGGLLYGIAVLSVCIVTMFYILTATESTEDLQECPPEHFPCGHGECVHRLRACDGESDCSNGADEDREICHRSEGSKGRYEGINRMTNSSRNCPECELLVVPDMCHCCSHQSRCEHLGLAQVPSNVSDTLTHLSLMGNRIARVNADDLEKYTSLRALYFRANQITVIEPGAFAKLKHLYRLSLDKNRLKTLDINVLVGLSGLGDLTIASNYLGREGLDLNVFANLSHLEVLELGNNNLQLKEQQFPELPNLKILRLEGNEVCEITENLFANLPALKTLKLERNRIISVHREAFTQQTRMTFLDLSFNKLDYLDEATFARLGSLQTLILDGNPFTTLAPRLLHPLRGLAKLSLKAVEIENIDLSMFAFPNKLNITYFKRFHYCSFVPRVPFCEPRSDGVSSMENLLADEIHRTTVWLVAAIVIFANAVVLFSRLVAHEENKVWGVFIRNLSGADFLMGIYLLLIAFNDLQYRGVYNEHANMWMSSRSCSAAGVLAMISSETSVLIMCFITVERYQHIVRCSPTMNGPLAKAGMAALWSAGLVAALLPLAVWRTHDFYGNNSMCFPLHISDPFVRGWKYTTFLFLGVNGAGVLTIAVMYTLIFISVRSTAKSTSRVVNENEFAVRFFFIAFTDSLCWVPIMTIKVMAISGIPISGAVYSWILIYVMPINSAVNPLLYTFTTNKFLTMFQSTMKYSTDATICECLSSKGVDEEQEAGAGGNSRGQSWTTDVSSFCGITSLVTDDDEDVASHWRRRPPKQQERRSQDVDGKRQMNGITVKSRCRDSAISEDTTTSNLSEGNSPIAQIASTLSESSL